MSKELALKIAESIPGFLWVEGCMYESGVMEAQAIESTPEEAIDAARKEG